jgi:hypothetical protein
MHKFFGSIVQNLVTWPTRRPEFVHPWWTCPPCQATRKARRFRVMDLPQSSAEVGKREHPAADALERASVVTLLRHVVGFLACD